MVPLRTGRKDQPKGKQWLLFKERDDEARQLDDYDVLEEMPLSVASGRNLSDIAADRDRVWGHESNGKAKASRRKKRTPARSTKRTMIPQRNGVDAAKSTYHGVRLTHPDKVLYPEVGITKLELADYYRAVADWILPHLANRPLVLVRCPEGRHKACFYQKHAGVGTPDNLRRFAIREATKTEQYILVDDEAGLISLAQMGILEIHAWGSQTQTLEQPDRLIFDLDPDPAVPWATVVHAARQVRGLLKQLHLESFVKITGGKGLHLVVPIAPKHAWDEAKAFCKQIAGAIVRADDQHYTASPAKAARHGKIFIDYLRNDRGATAVQPYSPRARSGAPVSTPLAWEELSPRIHSDHYTIKNVTKRLKSLKTDPWNGIATMHQALDKPMAQSGRFLGAE